MERNIVALIESIRLYFYVFEWLIMSMEGDVG